MQVARPNVTARTKKGYFAPTALNVLPLVLYAAAGIAYAIHFATPAAARRPRPRPLLLILAALAHTFVIGMQTMEVRHVPFANPSRAISTFVWLLALSYLYLEIDDRRTRDGRVHHADADRAADDPRAVAGRRERRSGARQPVVLGARLVAALRVRELRARRRARPHVHACSSRRSRRSISGYFYTRLPSLQTLDVMNSRAVAIGWLFLTVGVVVGVDLDGPGARGGARRSEPAGDGR